MQLIEFIKTNKIISLVILILIIYVIHLNNKVNRLSSKEHLTNCPDIDMTAIANLNKIAGDLQAGKLTVPGNLEIKGTLSVANGNMKVDSSGTVTCAWLQANEDMYVNGTLSIKNNIYFSGDRIFFGTNEDTPISITSANETGSGNGLVFYAPNIQWNGGGHHWQDIHP